MHHMQLSAHSRGLAAACSAFESSLEALQQPTINVVAVIAEGVPEADTKRLIAYARANNKILIGPATVGGIQVALTCLYKGMCMCKSGPMLALTGIPVLQAAFYIATPSRHLAAHLQRWEVSALHCQPSF